MKDLDLAVPGVDARAVELFDLCQVLAGFLDPGSRKNRTIARILYRAPLLQQQVGHRPSSPIRLPTAGSSLTMRPSIGATAARDQVVTDASRTIAERM